MSKILAQTHAIHMSLAPVADAFSGTVTSPVVSAKNAKSVKFLVYWGVGATGTTLITAEACDDVTPTNTSAVAYKYTRWNNAVATNAPAALVTTTTTGFTTTAGSNQAYLIEVDTDQLANSGYGFVRLKCVEQTDSPLLGGIFAFVDLQHPMARPTSVLS